VLDLHLLVDFESRDEFYVLVVNSMESLLKANPIV